MRTIGGGESNGREKLLGNGWRMERRIAEPLGKIEEIH
jgi:hypothetical protein